MPLISFTPEQIERLEQALVVWLASVRPNDKPHLVPLWFVFKDGRLFVCTPATTVKARNIALNRKVVVALEDGNHPLIVEGEATRLKEIPPHVAELFSSKYDWQIIGDETNDALIEIVPTRILTW